MGAVRFEDLPEWVAQWVAFDVLDVAELDVYGLLGHLVVPVGSRFWRPVVAIDGWAPQPGC